MTQHHLAYKGIRIDLKPASAHIHNDRHLLDYLHSDDPTARSLAGYILQAYPRLFDRELAISQDSLAIEIIGHIFADRMAESIDTILSKIAPNSKGPVARLLDRVERAAEVIDCGEASVDSNRRVWDALVPIRSVIFALAEH